MSLILDALNRSRQDQDPVPGLATEHVISHEPRGVKNYLPWVALGLAILLIVWLLVGRSASVPADNPAAAGVPVPTDREDATAVSALSKNVGDALSSVKAELQAKAESETQAPQQAAAVSNVRKEVAPISDANGLAETAAVQEVVEKTAASASSAVAADAQTQAGTPLEGDSASNDVVANLYRQKSEPSASPGKSPTVDAVERPARQGNTVAEEEVPIDITQMLEMAQAEMGGSKLVEHSAPLLAGLSQRVKDEIPTILYQQHEYSNRGGAISVMLNGKQLKQGGSISGIRVREILPNSVVLEFRGTVFRLRALNSWVNL